jgi:hypothetical protein
MISEFRKTNVAATIPIGQDNALISIYPVRRAETFFGLECGNGAPASNKASSARRQTEGEKPVSGPRDIHEYLAELEDIPGTRVFTAKRARQGYHSTSAR